MAILKTRKVVKGSVADVSKYLGSLAEEIVKALGVPSHLVEVTAIVEGEKPVIGLVDLKLPKVVTKKGVPVEEGYGYIMALIIDGKLYPELGLAIEAVYPELVAARRLGIALSRKARELLDYIETILDIAPMDIRRYLESVAEDVYHAWKEALAEGRASPRDILEDIELAMPSDEEMELLKRAYELVLAEAI